MAQSIVDLITTASDGDLCNEISTRINDYYGDYSELKSLSKEERVVACVWSCYGIIGNGGFQYLLEAPYAGDPRLKYVYRAFERLGCKEAIKAFDIAFKVFPDGFPPSNIDRRMTIYLKAMRKGITQEDEVFFKAPIEPSLAKYIRERPEAFAHLDASKSAKRAPKTVEKKVEKEPDQFEILPHWVRVAFAIHLGWEVFPFLREHWPKISSKRMAHVRKGLETAEKALYATATEEELRNAQMHCTMTAGAALLMEGENPPADGLKASGAASVAKVADMAIQAARDKPADSSTPVWQAWNSAHAAVPDNKKKEYEKNWGIDYHSLLRFSQQQGWTNRTKMPTDLWQQLWQFMADS